MHIFQHMPLLRIILLILILWLGIVTESKASRFYDKHSTIHCHNHKCHSHSLPELVICPLCDERKPNEREEEEEDEKNNKEYDDKINNDTTTYKIRRQKYDLA